LSRLQVELGEGGGVTLTGGTVIVPLLESLPPPPPHAETPAARIRMMLFNERFFMT
jgi:hypothetical protein